ncbi:MAG: hypothetical protein BA863_08295 [Desulfovibrio sp. S3730MH75]|nr:MAG: hypothetical protein BA863_08295 [Desulfovibrio sp. S3730MH75]
MTNKFLYWYYILRNRAQIHGKRNFKSFCFFIMNAGLILFFIGAFALVAGTVIYKTVDSSSWIEFTKHLKLGASEGVANYVIYRNLTLGIAGFIGISLAAWRSHSLGRQAYVAEQGHITERFIKATEQLGNEQVFIRIGAIHTLWRVAKDSRSEGDKKMILDMLCAFVRGSKPVRRLDTVEDYEYETIQNDVKIAIKLITQEISEIEMLSAYKTDFSGAFLQGADLRKAHLFEANLTNTNLSTANLEAAIMQHANLTNARLSFANVDGAGLQHTNLRNANFEFADIKTTKFSHANFWCTTLDNASFSQKTFHKVWLTKRLCKSINIKNHQWIKEGDDTPF